MFYYMIAGQMPWTLHSKAYIVGQITEGIQIWDVKVPFLARKLILQMTAMDPNDRPLPNEILASGDLTAVESEVSPVSLVSMHQSMSSDFVVKYSTGPTQQATTTPSEKKELVKAFGRRLGAACIGKKRRSGVFQSGVFTGKVLPPIETFQTS